VERSGRLISPYHYVPSGLEKTFAPFWETWHLVDKHFVHRDAVDHARMTRAAIEGMLFSLGDFPHTRYVTPDQVEGLKNTLEGHMEGIGAALQERNGKPTVESTLPGSPARAAGLKPGDILLEVAGKPVSGMLLDQIVEAVRGPAGSEVRLRVA